MEIMQNCANTGLGDKSPLDFLVEAAVINPNASSSRQFSRKMKSNPFENPMHCDYQTALPGVNLREWGHGSFASNHYNQPNFLCNQFHQGEPFSSFNDGGKSRAISRSIVMKLVQYDNYIHLVPSSEPDALALLDHADGRGGTERISVILESGFITNALTAPNRNNRFMLPGTLPAVSVMGRSPNISFTGLSTPKHIYMTSSDTYRVQVGKGSKAQRNGKFSRNTRTESDALWVCELALIVIDNPTSLEDILRGGNYDWMLERGVVDGPMDFAMKLVEKTEQLKIRLLLKEHEVAKAVEVYRKVLPPAVVAAMAEECSLFDTPASNTTTTASSAPSSSGSVVSESSDAAADPTASPSNSTSEPTPTLEPRKRRRTLKTTLPTSSFQIDPIFLPRLI